MKKNDNGDVVYYIRSSVLGGQVVAEVRNWGGGWSWSRGYVYWPSGELLAVQQGGVRWVHRDPVAKSQRLTDETGNVVAVVELDPWGGETERSVNPRSQPYVYGSYERDGNWSDQAQRRVYHGWYSRFYQPDPWDGSYDLTDPQSFNRYAYVQNDPVNFTDPSGLMMEGGVSCYIDGVESDCGLALRMVEAGAAVIGPASTFEYNHELGTWMRFVATANGSGWIPVGARHLGGLSWGWTDYSREDAPSYTYTLSEDRLGGAMQAGGVQARPFTTSLPEVTGQVILVAPVRSGPPLEDVRPSWENFQRALGRMFGSWEGFINSLFPPPGVLAGDITLFGPLTRGGTGLLSQLAKRRLAKQLGGIPRSAQPIAQGRYGQGTKWWEYRDLQGNIKIVVEHPDGTVHVGIPKQQSTHHLGGPPKYYPIPGTGHVGGP